jgi:hypothetical protein
VARILKSGGNAVHIMVIHKITEIQTAVNTLLAELTVEGVTDLKKVHIIEAGPEALVEFVISGAVKSGGPAQWL